MTHEEDKQLNLHISTSIFDEFSGLNGELKGAAEQEITDCMWKLQSVHHHCRNVQILERIQLDYLKKKSETLEDGWLVIGSEPTPLLRFEFEAELQQIYSTLNIASCAIAKMLNIGSTLSFRKLERKLTSHLETELEASIKDKVCKCISVLEDAKTGVLSDFLTSQSMRDRVVHFHCLRARPAQIMNENETKIIIDTITKDNVSVSSLDKRDNIEHKIIVKGEWTELLVMEFVVYGTEQAKWAENNEHIELGAKVSNNDHLDMTSYSEALYLGARSLVLNLLSAIIESNNAVERDAPKAARPSP